MNGTTSKTSDNLLLREFNVYKQLKLFKSLKRSQINGCLTFTNPYNKQQWHFYLDEGQIVYGTGGVHPVRRWQRNLMVNLPEVLQDINQTGRHLRAEEDPIGDSSWEYQKLYAWAKQNKITHQQANRAVRFVVEEILFDIVRSTQVLCRLEREEFLFPQLDLIQPESLIRQNEKWGRPHDPRHTVNVRRHVHRSYQAFDQLMDAP